jgi:DnaJ like chaperone protein
MSLWGKIIGGTAGFFVGGPLGALIGGLAGHAVDALRHQDKPNDPDIDQTQTIAFTVGVIALGAKMAKADGVVHPVEIEAFRRIFRASPDEMSNVGRLFDLAKRDIAGYEAYAGQLAAMFADRKPVLEELLGGLFHIAVADGIVHRAELDFLRRVATIFGFDEEAFARIGRIHVGKAAGQGDTQDDPYAILGLPAEADFAAVKAAYRRLAQDNHPDKLVAQGMPDSCLILAQEKMAAINAAYAAIEKAHKARSPRD